MQIRLIILIESYFMEITMRTITTHIMIIFFLFSITLGNVLSQQKQNDGVVYPNIKAFEIQGNIKTNKGVAEKKEQIFTNGTFYINADNRVNNLLVTDGIVTEYNVNLNDYPNAEVINLNGNTAYPGFNDSHVHLLETSPFIVLGINMGQCFDSQAIADSIAKRVSNYPPGKLIVGVGFSLEDYNKWNLDDLKKIDDVSPSNPVFLGDKLGHNVIVNTYAMQMCGLTPNDKVPFGGIVVIQNGKLTGMYRESAMTLVGNKIFPLLDKDKIKQSSFNMFNYWASIGYTGVVDLMGAAAGRIMHPEIAMELEDEGKLPLRVHYCYTIFNLTEIDSALKYKSMNTDMVRFVGCKIFIDGAYAAGQAWTTWTNKQNNNGLYYVYPTDEHGAEYNLNRIVDKLEENGLNCHYHIQGDQGIENLLNALDLVVAKKGKLDCIHTIIHSAFISKIQMQRIKSFNGKVVLTMQPGFWEVEDNLDYYYGDNYEKAYPVKEIIHEGITVGMSTDFTVSPINYCPATKVIGVAVTGGGKPEHHKPLTIRDMIHGFSYGSNATTPSTDLGKLEKGYKADMVVFNKDLYDVPPEEFTASYPKVTSIWIGGMNTYKSPEATDVYQDERKVPDNFSLEQNFPNPFNPSTVIRYKLPTAARVSLKLYDIIGRETATLVDEFKPAGSHTFIFNSNAAFTSGVYFYRLKAGDYSAVKKMILIK